MTHDIKHRLVCKEPILGMSVLPCGSIWSFAEIARDDPDRAATLEGAESPAALLTALKHALDEALDRGDVRFGCEHKENRWDDWRAVVQFSVSASLFDWFFNAKTGYRAHFRRDYMCGLKFDNSITEVLSDNIKAKCLDAFFVRELNSNFGYCQDVLISKHLFVGSLASNLSKIWLCSKRIGIGGTVECLPLGIGGPKIPVGDCDWVALCRNAEDAWLEVKGAFYGDAGFYQPKDPQERAKELQKKGIA